MAEVEAKKVILKNLAGEYLVPITEPYVAGDGISIEDNVISATGITGMIDLNSPYIEKTWGTIFQLPYDACVHWGCYASSATDDAIMEVSLDGANWKTVYHHDEGYIMITGCWPKGLYIKTSGGSTSNNYASIGYYAVKGVNIG